MGPQRQWKNVTGVTPPGRPAHTFTLTPVNLLEQYQPPAIGGPTATSYAYSLDRELAQVTRPDGQALTAGYDGAGRLATLTTPTGTITFTYDPTSGRVSQIAAPQATLAYTYDGPLRASPRTLLPARGVSRLGRPRAGDSQVPQHRGGQVPLERSSTVW